MAAQQEGRPTTTPAGSDSAGTDDGGSSDTDQDDYADEITELQQQVDGMAKAKSSVIIAKRAELQAELSQLREKQRAQWPLSRRIAVANRRQREKEQAVKRATTKHEEAQAAAEAAH